MQTNLKKTALNTLRDPINLSFLTILLISNATFMNWNAFRCFNFFDMGSFFDASWRVYKGQKPYIDFIFISGPIYLYVNALFFCLFGVGKAAILAHILTTHSLVIVFAFVVSRKYLSFLESMLATILTTISFYWPISFPWYDQLAHFWGICAISTLLLKMPLSESRDTFKVYVFFGIMAALSFMTKTNIGGLYVTLLFLVALRENRRMAALGG